MRQQGWRSPIALRLGVWLVCDSTDDVSTGTVVFSPNKWLSPVTGSQSTVKEVGMLGCRQAGTSQAVCHSFFFSLPPSSMVNRIVLYCIVNSVRFNVRKSVGGISCFFVGPCYHFHRFLRSTVSRWVGALILKKSRSSARSTNRLLDTVDIMESPLWLWPSLYENFKLQRTKESG